MFSCFADKEDMAHAMECDSEFDDLKSEIPIPKSEIISSPLNLEEFA